MALNVLENKIRLLSRRHSRVDQFRDVCMPHAAQNVALASESLLACISHTCDIEKLHCYAPLKPSIISFCQPDTAHTTVADLRHHV